MTDGSSMVAAATLIGDHTRAKMLTALMAGRALTDPRGPSTFVRTASAPFANAFT